MGKYTVIYIYLQEKCKYFVQKEKQVKWLLPLLLMEKVHYFLGMRNNAT